MAENEARVMRTFDLASFVQSMDQRESPLRSWQSSMDADSWFGFLYTTLAVVEGRQDFIDAVPLQPGMLDMIVSGNNDVGTIVFVAPEDMTDEDFIWLKMRWSR